MNELLAIHPDGRFALVPNNYEGIKEGTSHAVIDFTVANDAIGFYVDDEGMLNGSVLNVPASMYAGRPLYGSVVMANAHPDDDGNTLPPDGDQMRIVKSLANAWRSVTIVAADLGQNLDVVANPDTVPPAQIIGLTDDFDFGDPLPDTPAPVCPNCGVESLWNGHDWVSTHELGCAPAPT